MRSSVLGRGGWSRIATGRGGGLRPCWGLGTLQVPPGKDAHPLPRVRLQTSIGASCEAVDTIIPQSSWA